MGKMNYENRVNAIVENYRESLMSINKFQEDVNKITMEKAGFKKLVPPIDKELMNLQAQLDDILNSRMNQYQKECVLDIIEVLTRNTRLADYVEFSKKDSDYYDNEVEALAAVMIADYKDKF